MKFEKPPLTYKEQIELLKRRGLVFDDEQKAELQLSNVSYFRLSAYMLPFKKNVGSEIIDEFRYGTNWKSVYNLYVFDRKLRLLFFDAIDKIEVALRCQLVYVLSHKYGSHWQDNASILKAPYTITLNGGEQRVIDVYSDIQHHIADQLSSQQTEQFIKHYHDTYDYPKNPPSWMSVEVMYFNQLSKICSNLRERADKVAIAKHFSLPPDEFISWLHTINYLRNICAHHARLWNREIKIIPALLRFSKDKIWITEPGRTKRSRIYYTLCMINYLLQSVNPNSSFSQRLKQLISEYMPKISAMGFPENWESEKIWE